MSSSSSLTVAVLSPCDNPALAGMPKGMPGVEFIVANDLETFQASPNLAEVEAIMFCPPADAALLDELWPHVPSVKWCHGFFAGVDSLANFMPRLAEKGVPLSNGRGAFSQSLAECTPCFPHPHTPLLRVRPPPTAAPSSSQTRFCSGRRRDGGGVPLQQADPTLPAEPG